MVEISVVIPVFRSADTLIELSHRISSTITSLGKTFEIILVDDGSPDESWSIIQKLSREETQVSGIRLSRNFGQHYAISAGLKLSKGNDVVVMDCDLQDLPEEISRLYIEKHKGFDYVLARRLDRTDSFVRRAISKIFYSALSRLSGINHDPSVANFGVYDRKIIDLINQMPERLRYFPSMVQWLGFNSNAIDVAHGTRQYGKSNYNWSRLLSLGTDIILAYSDKPIRLAAATGVLLSVSGIGVSIWVFLSAILGEYKVSGYASLMVSLWTLSGLTILIVSLVGLYVGKTFEGIKQRPLYVVDEETLEHE